MMVSDLIKELEEVVNNKWVGKKFEDISDVRKDIAVLIKDILPDTLDVSNSDVILKDSEATFFSCNIEIDEDKRYKFSKAGRVIKVQFKAIEKVGEKMELDEYIYTRKRKVAEEAVRETEEKIESLKSDLIKFENLLIEKREELKLLI